MFLLEHRNTRNFAYPVYVIKHAPLLLRNTHRNIYEHGSPLLIHCFIEDEKISIYEI